MNLFAGTKRSPRFYIIFSLVTLAAIAIWFAVRQHLTMAQMQEIARAVKQHAISRPLLVFVALALSQMVGMVFSLPTKGLLTVLIGALLGPFLGTACTASGVLVGTSILFFASRHLLREKVLRHFVGKVGDVEQRFSQNPIRTMIGLRLFILLPYGPCTIAAALSSMRYRDFLIGTIIGDFPVVLLYTIAGDRLFALTSSTEALSPTTVGALVAIGCIFLAWAFFSRTRRGRRETDLPFGS